MGGRIQNQSIGQEYLEPGRKGLWGPEIITVRRRAQIRFRRVSRARAFKTSTETLDKLVGSRCHVLASNPTVQSSQSHHQTGTDH